MNKPEIIKEIVKGQYRQAALQVKNGGGSCCGTVLPHDTVDPISSKLYGEKDAAAVPTEAVVASLGCGNPTALADLHAGDTVLDLGSGGGIDVLLSAKRVGPTGKVYGLDMTDEMLALARENQQKAHVHNVEFLKGDIEQIPLPDNSVDVIISNCVINLSGEKDRVLTEAFRVLRPGGRLAISDIVVRETVPEEVRRSMELWAGCVAGALAESEYRTLLAQAGFEDIAVEPTRIYSADDAREFLRGAGLYTATLITAQSVIPAKAGIQEKPGFRVKPGMTKRTGLMSLCIDLEQVAAQVDGTFMAAFVRAHKPGPPLLSKITFPILDLGQHQIGTPGLYGIAGGPKWLRKP